MPGKGDILDIKQDMRNFMNGGNKMNLSKFNDLDLEEKIVESNFNNDFNY